MPPDPDPDLEPFSDDELREFSDGIERLVDTVLSGKASADGAMRAKAYLALKAQIETMLDDRAS